jgi:hypothetical protein
VVHSTFNASFKSFLSGSLRSSSLSKVRLKSLAIFICHSQENAIEYLDSVLNDIISVVHFEALLLFITEVLFAFQFFCRIIVMKNDDSNKSETQNLENLGPGMQKGIVGFLSAGIIRKLYYFFDRLMLHDSKSQSTNFEIVWKSLSKKEDFWGNIIRKNYSRNSNEMLYFELQCFLPVLTLAQFRILCVKHDCSLNYVLEWILKTDFIRNRSALVLLIQAVSLESFRTSQVSVSEVGAFLAYNPSTGFCYDKWSTLCELFVSLPSASFLDIFTSIESFFDVIENFLLNHFDALIPCFFDWINLFTCIVKKAMKTFLISDLHLYLSNYPLLTAIVSYSDCHLKQNLFKFRPNVYLFQKIHSMPIDLSSDLSTITKDEILPGLLILIFTILQEICLSQNLNQIPVFVSTAENMLSKISIPKEAFNALSHILIGGFASCSSAVRTFCEFMYEALLIVYIEEFEFDIERFKSDHQLLGARLYVSSLKKVFETRQRFPLKIDFLSKCSSLLSGSNFQVDRYLHQWLECRISK